MSENEFNLKAMVRVFSFVAAVVFIIASAIVLTYGEPSIAEAIAVRIGGAW